MIPRGGVHTGFSSAPHSHRSAPLAPLAEAPLALAPLAAECLSFWGKWWWCSFADMGFLVSLFVCLCALVTMV